MSRFIIFGILGIFGSVLFGSLKNSVESRRLALEGGATLALFPAYGCIAFLYPMIAMRTGAMPWYGRGIVYMCAFFVLQYALGLILRKFDVCPWNYSGSGSLGGLINLKDAPIWFAAGLAIEWVYPFVKHASVVLK